MATSLPPPGTSRPPPPPSPADTPVAAPVGEPVDELVEHADVDVPSWLAPPPPVAVTPSPNRMPAAVLDLHTRSWHDERPWRAERWIQLVGFAMVAVALGVIANQAWLMGIANGWVWWSSLAVVPPALAALAALFGWRHARRIAWLAVGCTCLVAVVGLLRQPPIGIPQTVSAIAAIAITLAAGAVAQPASGEDVPDPQDDDPIVDGLEVAG